MPNNNTIRSGTFSDVLSFTSINDTVKRLAAKKIEEYSAKFEAGEMMPTEQTLSSLAVACNTHGRLYTKTPAFQIKLENGDFILLEEGYFISTQRLRDKHLREPTMTFNEWIDCLDRFPVGTIIHYIAPPFIDFLLVKRVIYEKLEDQQWKQTLEYVDDIPDPFLYPGIRDDVAEELKVEQNNNYHKAFNSFVHIVKGLKAINKGDIKTVEKERQQ